MTSQEMMLPWFGVLVDRDATPDMIAVYRPPDLDGPFGGVHLPPKAGLIQKIEVAHPIPQRQGN